MLRCATELSGRSFREQLKSAVSPPGPQSAVLSSLLGPWGPKVLYCRRFWPPGAPKCCTVGALGPLGLQSAVLSALLALRGPQVLYCRRLAFRGEGGPTLEDSTPGGVLSSRVGPPTGPDFLDS